jgi:hypothetical protein
MAPIKGPISLHVVVVVMVMVVVMHLAGAGE